MAVALISSAISWFIKVPIPIHFYPIHHLRCTERSYAQSTLYLPQHDVFGKTITQVFSAIFLFNINDRICPESFFVNQTLKIWRWMQLNRCILSRKFSNGYFLLRSKHLTFREYIRNIDVNVLYISVCLNDECKMWVSFIYFTFCRLEFWSSRLPSHPVRVLVGVTPSLPRS